MLRSCANEGSYRVDTIISFMMDHPEITQTHSNSDAVLVLLFVQYTLQDGNPILYFSRYVLDPTAKSYEDPLSMHSYERRVTVVVRECSRSQFPKLHCNNNKMGCTLVMLLQNNATCLASFGANILLLIYIKNSLETYQNAFLESELVGFPINR